jgi:tetratricopeptide (TPR) repeat protein
LGLGSSRERWSIAIVLFATALATAPKLGNAFVWDDLPLIVGSDFIHDPANAPSVFGVDTMFAADGGRFQSGAGLDTYRPLSILTFFVDAALSGRNPIAYHVDNWLAHLLCVFLVFALARRLLSASHRSYAPWAAAFFGLHPVLGEAHVWINGRSDVWCTVFVLLGMLAYLRSGEPGRRASSVGALGAGAFAAFLAALLFKETALAILPLLVVWPGPSWRRRWPLVLAPIVYLVLRAAALRGMHATGGTAHLELALIRLPLLWFDGLWSTLVPSRVMPRYLNEEYSRIANAAFLVAIAAAIVLAILVFRYRRRWPLGAFGLAWFALALAPASLVACMAWYGFGRFLYLPIAVLAIAIVDAVAYGIDAIERRRGPRVARLARLGGIGYLVLFGVRLWLSTENWDGSAAFYHAIIAESPRSSHGYGGLGAFYTERKDYADAILLLQEAVGSNPADHRYLNNLGTTYLRNGQVADARHVADLGLQRFPAEAKFEYLEALAMATSESPRARLEHILHGLELQPNHPGLRNLLGFLVVSGPDHAEYRRALDELVAEHPAWRPFAIRAR